MRNHFEGTIFLVIMSLAFVAIGAILIFIPQLQPLYLCYLMCAGFIIFGIILIVRYFMTEAYKRMHEYGFSIGVLLVILGSCSLARADEVTENLTLYLGLCILISSVVMLQSAIQMKNLESTIWQVMLGGACVAIFCAAIILADLSLMKSFIDRFTYWVLFLESIVSMASLWLVQAQIKKANKKAEKTEEILLDEAEKEDI